MFSGSGWRSRARVVPIHRSETRGRESIRRRCIRPRARGTNFHGGKKI